MNDITITAWSALVTARVERDRAEVRFDAAMRGAPVAPRAEKTCITTHLEQAFDGMRSAQVALAVAELTAGHPLG